MSESNNTFPFPGVEGGDTLDIDTIFGNNIPGGDVNPFEMPMAQGPIEVVSASQEPAPPAGQELSGEPAAGSGNEQPPAAPAAQTEPVPAPEPEPQSKETASAEEPNPIAAAFSQQEEKNTQQGLLEKSPVFYYGSAKEAISDSSMTFEELRIAKSDDFPELAEGKRVSWTVEYGKVVKLISDPKGTVIRAIKEEIERSKAFLDGLKKAKDKCPDCLVKPKVTAQSKGIAAYKGVFPTLEAARSSDKIICLIPAGDGRVYEMRTTEMGEFIAPKDNVAEFELIRAGFTPALPLIPRSLLCQIIAFFRRYMNEREEFEAMAHILWDREREEFAVYIPEQEVSKSHIHADLRRDAPSEKRYLHYADIHSHNSMEAKFSPVDDRDEQATRLYIVLGRLDKFFPDISVRMSCGGTFLELDPATVLESVEDEFPMEWLDKVKTCRRPAPLARMEATGKTPDRFWRDAR